MRKFISLLLVVTATFLAVQNVAANESRNVKEYNLQNGVGLKGYDPVSYFPEGGNAPIVGLSQFRLDYMGVMYFFANSKNLELFTKAADKYEPTYGGYCAYAMASGSKVDIDPKIYTFSGNRIHFFVSSRAKRNFDADVKGYEGRADMFWKQISGEEPRK